MDKRTWVKWVNGDSHVVETLGWDKSVDGNNDPTTIGALMMAGSGTILLAQSQCFDPEHPWSTDTTPISVTDVQDWEPWPVSGEDNSAPSPAEGSTPGDAEVGQ